MNFSIGQTGLADILQECFTLLSIEVLFSLLLPLRTLIIVLLWGWSTIENVSYLFCHSVVINYQLRNHKQKFFRHLNVFLSDKHRRLSSFWYVVIKMLSKMKT